MYKHATVQKFGVDIIFFLMFFKDVSSEWLDVVNTVKYYNFK